MLGRANLFEYIVLDGFQNMFVVVLAWLEKISAGVKVSI